MSRFLSFVKLIINHGNFFQEPLDFYTYKEKILEDIPVKISKTKKQSLHKSKFSRFIFNVRAFISLAIQGLGKRKVYVFPVLDNVFYLRIPKCASTSILEKILVYQFPEFKNYHFKPGQIDLLAEEMLPVYLVEKISEANLFCVVRNPLKRLVSAYLDISNTQYGYIYQNYIFNVLKSDDDFETFIDKISSIPGILLDQNLQPQTDFIPNNNIKVLRLEKDFEAVKELLPNPDEETKNRNKGNYTRYWMDYYSYSSYTKAFKIYKKDIELLNYKEEAKELAQYILKKTSNSSV